MLAIVGQLSNSSNLQVWAEESADDEVLGMVVRTGKLHKYSQDFRTGNLLIPACMHSYFLTNFLNNSSSALLLYLVMV